MTFDDLLRRFGNEASLARPAVQSSLAGDMVDIPRPAAHHPTVVRADVPDAYVIRKNDHNVGFSLRHKSSPLGILRSVSDSWQPSFRLSPTGANVFERHVSYRT
jgi:hypothetical protein